MYEYAYIFIYINIVYLHLDYNYIIITGFFYSISSGNATRHYTYNTVLWQGYLCSFHLPSAFP